ncbi:uncharacterized protein LOC104655240 [Rhinopithecus roxellana]|uniref:uncharacterized protein LOC104655240 n=1 Tax=Rhinopithecus roxellana TaxID=61622 RepID=UPI0012372F54|nr:uncharacterized protein LOC104655240 [Rhinopithecus roxellana]
MKSDFHLEKIIVLLCRAPCSYKKLRHNCCVHQPEVVPGTAATSGGGQRLANGKAESRDSPPRWRHQRAHGGNGQLALWSPYVFPRLFQLPNGQLRLLLDLEYKWPSYPNSHLTRANRQPPVSFSAPGWLCREHEGEPISAAFEVQWLSLGMEIFTGGTRGCAETTREKFWTSHVLPLRQTVVGNTNNTNPWFHFPHPFLANGIK